VLAFVRIVLSVGTTISLTYLRGEPLLSPTHGNKDIVNSYKSKTNCGTFFFGDLHITCLTLSANRSNLMSSYVTFKIGTEN
jgi:hypothetical protein